MPSIFVYMRQGRTIDQKRKLTKLLTEAVVESLGVKPEQVGIHLVEQKEENIARGGTLMADRK